MLIRATIAWLITGALLGGCVVDYAGGVRYRDHFYSFSGHCLSDEAVHGAPFDVGRAWLFGYRGTPARAINGIGTDLAVAVDSDASTRRLARTASSRCGRRSAMISAGAS